MRSGIRIVGAAYALALCGGVAAPQHPAQAAVVEYTDRPSFNAATTGLTTIDFESLGTSLTSFTYWNGGLTTQGVSFADANNHLNTVGPAFDPVYNYFTGVVLSAAGGYPLGNSTLTATLPAGETAVGVDLGMNVPPHSSFVVTLSTGDVFDVTGGSPDGPTELTGIGFLFVGFTSTVPITSITFEGLATGIFTEGGYVPAYDNFSFGAAGAPSSAVPEPASLVLFGTALIGLGLARRKKGAGRLKA